MRLRVHAGLLSALFLAFLPASCGSSGDLASFCGNSTQGPCNADADCLTSGCGGEICQSNTEDPLVSECIYRECSDTSLHDVRCACQDAHCRWSD